jgi:dUTP pyrophosphatase
VSDESVPVEITRLDADLALPSQQHAHDAGYDLHAREDAALASGGGRALVPTGVAVAIPPGRAGFVLPRSGLALRHGVTLLNTPGLIDPLYRGELKVLLVNTDPTQPYTVHRGDRIAQLVVQRVDQVTWTEVADLDRTSRDTFGFGSTGR